MQQAIPVKAYTLGKQAYPAFPHIARVIYPECRAKNDNTDASPGANILYLFFETAEKAAQQEHDRHLFRSFASLSCGQTCGNCRHFHSYYEDDPRDTVSVRRINMGRCSLKSAGGKTVKARGTCESFMR